MCERKQQLASPFAQLTDFLAELFGNLYDLLTNVGLASLAQFIFVVSLDDHCRANSDQHEYDQANRQTHVRDAQPGGSAFDRYRLAERRACFMRAHLPYLRNPAYRSESRPSPRISRTGAPRLAYSLTKLVNKCLTDYAEAPRKLPPPTRRGSDEWKDPIYF